MTPSDKCDTVSDHSHQEEFSFAADADAEHHTHEPDTDHPNKIICCYDVFSQEFIKQSNLKPTWNVQERDGKSALDLLKKSGKRNIPSSDKFTLYTITRPDCNRVYHLFKCQHENGCCNRILLTLSKFTSHMRCHTNVRPFQCDLCDMSFTQRGNLQKHREIHQGIKRFTCDHCGNKYSKKYNLMVHLNSLKRKEALKSS